jgi:hypothetical protein
MQRIMFKKQAEGMWRRDDGEIKTLVNGDAMFDEVMILIDKKWKLVRHGVTHTRMIEMTKEDVTHGR